MTAADEKFVKFYEAPGGREFRHTTMVNHQGTIIAFAMDDAQRIFFAVLNLDQEKDSPLDVHYWDVEPRELRFPDELAQVGFGVVPLHQMPVVTRDGLEVSDGPALKDREKDLLLSTTARLTADAPIQVLSDGRHIYLFRQSISADHERMVTVSDSDIPVVDKTLLLDRFVYNNGLLKRKREVRYQRSRSKDRPASRKDTLGHEDLERRPFYEPTQELAFIRNLSEGRFSILLIPTSLPGVERWQIFAYNEESGKIDSFNIERAKDGLFNTKGTRYFTSPDPTYQSDVFERKPGSCPFTGRPLIPIASEPEFAESCLALNGQGDFVDMGKGEELNPGERFWTVEQWIKWDGLKPDRQREEGDYGTIYNKEDCYEAAVVIEDKKAYYRYAWYPRYSWRGGKQFEVKAGQWIHAAVVYDGENQILYRNGEEVYRRAQSGDIGAKDNPFSIGARAYEKEKAHHFLAGRIDEFRIWDRARSAEEIREAMSRRLVGNESGLVAYWRFDEGAGKTVYDQTVNGLNGTLHGGRWVPSDALIGEQPGIRRSSFGIEGRRVGAGLSSLLYYEQEKAIAGYEPDQPKPAKRGARVMVAVVTTPENTATMAANQQSDQDHHIAILDFAVSRYGKLALLNDTVELEMIDREGGSGGDQAIDSLLENIRSLEGQSQMLGRQAGLLVDEIRVHDPQVDIPEDLSVPLEPVINHLSARIKELESKVGDAGDRSAVDRDEMIVNAALLLNDSGVQPDASHAYFILKGDQFIRCGPDRRADSKGVQAITDLWPGVPNEWGQNLDAAFSLDGQTIYLLQGDQCLAYDTLTNAVQPDFPKRISETWSGLQEFWTEGIEAAASLDPGQLYLFKKDQCLTCRLVNGELKGSEAKPIQEMWPNLPEDWTLEIGAAVAVVGETSGLLLFKGDQFVELSDQDDILPLQLNEGTWPGIRGLLGPLNAQEELLNQLRRAHMVLNALASIQEQIAAKKALIQSEVKLPMRPVSIDASGLSVSGALLGFAWTADAPLLLDSVNGRIGLYFRGGKDQFFAAYYDVLTERAVYHLSTDKDEPISFEVRSADLGMIPFRITVEDGTTAEHCKITIEDLHFDAAEIWEDVPRVAATFVATLNGTNGNYDYDAKVSSQKRFFNPANGTLLFQLDPAMAGGMVQNGVVEGRGDGTVSHWYADSPGNALNFIEPGGYLTSPSETLAAFSTKDDLTMEAWMYPTAYPESVDIILNHHGDGVGYALGIAQESRTLAFDGTVKNYFIVNPFEGFPPEAITVELWLKTEDAATSRGLISYAVSGIDNAFLLFDQRDLRVHINGPSSKAAGLALNDGHWHHLAVTWQSQDGQVKFYVDGILRHETILAKGQIIPDGGSLVLAQDQDAVGGRFDPKQSFKGRMDEIRIWNEVLTEQTIRDVMGRRLDGNETGLVSYWRFEDGQARDYSGNGNDGLVMGSPQASYEPVPFGAPRYRSFAGVGDQFRLTRRLMEPGRWNHLAAVFRQSYALQFNRESDLVECEHDVTLDLNRDLTVEVILRLKDLDTTRGILTKGDIDDGTDQDVPYSFYVETDGRLVFAFEDKEHVNHFFTSDRLLKAGMAQRAAVTRKYNFEVTDSGAVNQWFDIRFYIDGQIVGKHRYDGSIGSSNQPLQIGRARARSPQRLGIMKECHFKGEIAEVRLWNTALERADIGHNLKGNENGLVSWWRFEENEGNLALDSKGGNHGLRQGAKWVVNPDPKSSSLEIFVNGESLYTEIWKKEDRARLMDYGDEGQFTVGARLSEGAPRNTFRGQMDELRIWKTARTQEQIQDNLFRKLIGNREQLIAYYVADKPDDKQLKDHSGRELHLHVYQVSSILSTAPIGDETARVRDALAGIKTDFHDTISGRPAVGEYGDTQYDADGNMTGVLKRCYAYIKDGNWHLLTGFKVGDLVLEWIGQAQYDPQLFGFIEGAPPAPSENLTVEDDYASATWVQLIEAAKTVYSYSVSEDKGLDTSLEASFAVGAKSESEVGGLVASTEIEDTEVKVGGKISFETSTSWLYDATLSSARKTTQASKLEMQGIREKRARYRGVGRRYVPRNVGFALVKSETADIFAMRLMHNGVMVGYKMRPNPDIPPDWNIITFEMNPRYVCQGTLDGKVGLTPHRLYPGSDYSSDRSYFKPIEAYALKRRIEQEEQTAKLLYERDFVLASSLDLPDISKQNLVNTYVWTADGGTFAETQEAMDVQQEQIGGHFSIKGMAGFTMSTDITVSKVSNAFGMEAMFGGHYCLTKSKSRESETSFSLAVSLDGLERDIYGAQTGRSEDQRPAKQPGKVDAYRFMTFYLKPDKEHFKDFKNKVIDQEWLESGSPDAIALNQALDKENGIPWRVLHRVTYVSRILPEASAPGATTVEKTLRADNVESNYELIRRLEPLVRTRTDSYEEFQTAVRQAIAEDQELVELSANEEAIEAVIAYMSTYFQVFPAEDDI